MDSKKKTISLILFGIFSVVAFLALFPFFCLLLASFKPSTDLMRFGLNLELQPEVLSFKNYYYLLTDGSIYFVWFKNSVVITILFTVLSLFFSSLVGYALGVYDFKGRNLIFGTVLFVMMIPLEIILLPLYKLTVTMHLIDSYWGVILPFMVSPFAIFFFRQYAQGIPRDFIDAARIDGCTEFGIFFRIMRPLMAPAFGAMAILQALGSWNNLVWPLVVLHSEEKFTLPIGLSSLLTPYGSNYDILISGSILSVIPIIILFMFFQRFFISGLTIGGVKG